MEKIEFPSSSSLLTEKKGGKFMHENGFILQIEPLPLLFLRSQGCHQLLCILQTGGGKSELKMEGGSSLTRWRGGEKKKENEKIRGFGYLIKN